MFIINNANSQYEGHNENHTTIIIIIRIHKCWTMVDFSFCKNKLAMLINKNWFSFRVALVEFFYSPVVKKIKFYFMQICSISKYRTFDANNANRVIHLTSYLYYLLLSHTRKINLFNLVTILSSQSFSWTCNHNVKKQRMYRHHQHRYVRQCKHHYSSAVDENNIREREFWIRL